MTPNTSINTRARVSIAERLVPAVGYAVAAASGAVGGVMLLQFLNSLRNAETSGYDSFYLGTARIEIAVGTVLGVAAAIGAIGILVAMIRLFTRNKKSSPPGVLFFVVGVMSLIPPFAIHYGMHLMEETVASRASGGISTIGETEAMIAYFSMVWPLLMVVVLLAFSFVPFSARLGRKFASVIFLIAVEIFVVVLAGIFFWQARHAMGHTSVGLFQ